MENNQIQGIKLETALYFTQHGISVVPMHFGTKIPRIKWRRYQQQPPTEAELLRWFRIPSNGAAVTGTNNLTIIDFDEISEYVRWSQWVATQGSWVAKTILQDAYKVRTARGLHVYTRCVKEIRNLHMGKIDIKGRGGLVMLPGSVHPSGVVYTEYQAGGFPSWENLAELFPAEKLRLLDRSEPTPYRVERKAPTELTVADVLDSKVRADLNEIKQRHKIEDYLSNLIFTGEHWAMTRCPFHDDDNPSFWIDTEQQICGCFAGCTAKPMDVIDLYARLNKISIQDAIEELSQK